MRRWFARHVAFPMKEALKRQRSETVLAEISRTQWLSRDEHRARQWIALREQVEHAYAHTVFYRDWFDAAGAQPGDIRSFDDYAKLPVVSKPAYTEAARSLIARGHEGDVSFSKTSGSTGAPSLVPISRSIGSIALAHAWRGRGWWGIHLGDREFKFWGRSASFERTARGRLAARLKLTKDRLMNVRSVSPFDMSEEALARLTRQLRTDRPDVVFGYGQAILLLAEYLHHRGVDAGASGPRVVIYTSEFLQPSQRRFISDVFQAPVASEYGAVECGIIAYDAPCGAMHASDEALLLEQAGSPPKLLVTHLVSFPAPLLRYELGDLVELGTPVETCGCGRGLSVIRSMSGRNNDLVYKPNGEPVHAELFDYAMRQATGVRRYRIVQNDLSSISILLVMRDPSDREAVARDIVTRLRPYLGEELGIDVQQVSELQPLPSGKFQWVVSKVPRASDVAPA